jgi:hypothetical protein
VHALRSNGHLVAWLSESFGYLGVRYISDILSGIQYDQPLGLPGERPSEQPALLPAMLRCRTTDD